jgi:hypothetical protein
MDLLKELLPLTEGKQKNKSVSSSDWGKNLIAKYGKENKALKKAESVNESSMTTTANIDSFIRDITKVLSRKKTVTVKVSKGPADKILNYEFIDTKTESVNESFGHSDNLWDSSEFESEIHKLDKALTAVKAKLESHMWIEYMKVTDSNFSTDAEMRSGEVVDKVQEAIDALDALYDHMEEAS